ncbi:MAG: shikimate dehydrogenase [Candidatus Eremiobacteraeota bacterium]|nr:shikimate dehydrogenase [Candidatus Eremiobacteraeota bacterium]MBC5827555.1 shikimate dehydrogenase [Candidatus Eremiobacteraeota bacterium]
MRKFGFLVHPLSLEDIKRYEPGAADKGVPLIRKILEWMPPYKVSKVENVVGKTGEQVEGYFIGIGLLPDQMLELPRDSVMERILRGVDMANEWGCDIVGLGGFTAVIGDGGITVAEHSRIPVTTGNSYTIAAGVQSLLRGAREMEIDVRSASATVVGATGSIGSACAQILGNYVARLKLTARNATRLKNLARAIGPHVSAAVDWTTDITAAVRSSDLVLTATAATSSLILPEDLRPGAVVCELSLPHDVSRRVATERPDVLVTEGGNILMPGEVRFNFDFGLPKNVALACVSETMILALENRLENYSVGRGINLEKVLEIERLAEKQGFRLAGMRAFDKAITDEQIAQTRAYARSARAAAPPQPMSAGGASQ